VLANAFRLFETKSAEISSSSHELLHEIADLLLRSPDISLWRSKAAPAIANAISAIRGARRLVM
jgi:hypothetical protein